MKVSFNGFNDKALTFMCEEEITKGYPVNITDNYTVSKADWAGAKAFFWDADMKPIVDSWTLN